MRQLIFTILFFLTSQANAQLLRPDFEGVRPAGMGSAFTALADDANLLFYNPAGLARVKGAHFHLMDFSLGVDSSNTLTRVNNAFFKSDFEHLVRSDTQYLRLSFRPTLIFPYFGISFFQDAQGFFDVKSPLTTGIDVWGFNDLGVIIGGGIPLGEWVSVGVSAKVFSRTGVDFSHTASEIINDIPLLTAIASGEVYNVFKNLARNGWAVATTAGILADIPLQNKGKGAPKLTASAVLENIGTVQFKALGGITGPKAIPQNLTLGVAYSVPMSKDWVWNVTSDVRHMMEVLPFIKQFHFGTEFRHKVFGIRGGISDGYAAGGFSIEFPPHTRLHFATYSKELGGKLNERQIRWYLTQLVIGFNPL